VARIPLAAALPHAVLPLGFEPSALDEQREH